MDTRVLPLWKSGNMKDQWCWYWLIKNHTRGSGRQYHCTMAFLRIIPLYMIQGNNYSPFTVCTIQGISYTIPLHLEFKINNILTSLWSEVQINQVFGFVGFFFIFVCLKTGLYSRDLDTKNVAIVHWWNHTSRIGSTIGGNESEERLTLKCSPAGQPGQSQLALNYNLL